MEYRLRACYCTLPVMICVASVLGATQIQAQFVSWAAVGGSLNGGNSGVFDLVVVENSVVATGSAADGFHFPGDTLRQPNLFAFTGTASLSLDGQVGWLREGILLQVPNHGFAVATGAAGSVILGEGAPLAFGSDQFDSGILTVSGASQSGEYLWTTAFSDTSRLGDQIAFGKSMHTDASGNIYVSGVFMGTMAFADTSFTSMGVDMFSLSLTPSGEPRWLRSVGGPGIQSNSWYALRPRGAAAIRSDGRQVIPGWFPQGTQFGTDSTGSAVTSMETEAAFVHYDSTGRLQNVQFACDNLSVCGTAPGVVRIDASREGGTVTAWAFGDAGSGQVQVGNATYIDNDFGGAFVAKHDSVGALVWSEQILSDGNEILFEVISDGSGGMFVAGQFDGETLHVADVTMTKQDLQAEAEDGFIFHFDSTGQVVWSLQLQGRRWQQPSALALDSSGNLYVGVSFNLEAIIGEDRYVEIGSSPSWLILKVSYDTANSQEIDRIGAGVVLDVFPNPAARRIVVQGSRLVFAPSTVEVVDAAGRVVISQKVEPAIGDFRQQLDVSGLAAGLYFVWMKGDGWTAASKVVIL